VKKELKRVYDKGVVQSNGWVKPIILEGYDKKEIEREKREEREFEKREAIKRRIEVREQRLARELMKTDFYDSDPTLRRTEQLEDILREAKRYLTL